MAWVACTKLMQDFLDVAYVPTAVSDFSPLLFQTLLTCKSTCCVMVVSKVCSALLKSPSFRFHNHGTISSLYVVSISCNSAETHDLFDQASTSWSS